MKYLRFIIISFLTSLLVLNTVFWRKTVAVMLCVVFGFNSASCYSLLGDSGKANAAQPKTPPFTSSAKQLDAEHAEIRLIFPNNCEFISHLTKTPKGIIQDSIEYSHNNPEGCIVKPFIARYSNGGKTVEVQIKGQNDRLRLDASVNPGKIEQNYQDASGKVVQEVTLIPTEILDHLNKLQKNPLVERGLSALPSLKESQPKQNIQEPWLVVSNNAKKLYPPSSSKIAFDPTNSCDWAILGESACDWGSTITGFPGVMGVATAFLPALGMTSLVSGIVCWGLYGGFPPIFGIWETALVQKGVNLSNAYSRNARAWGKTLPANQRLWNDLDQLLSKTLPQVRYLDALQQQVEDFAKSFNGTDLKDVIPGALHNFLGDCKKEKKQGSSANDPHLTTLDGLKYDLQTVGEYILIKSNNDNFEVQNRQEPYNASTAINSAVAIKVGRDRIALYAKEFPDFNTSTPLRVNGKPTTIQGDKLSLADGSEILKQGNTYVIKSAKGEKVLVDLLGSGKSGFLNVSAFVPNRSGTYSGLLGNVNGNPNDDLQTRNGISISANRSSYKSENLYLEQIHKKFANSWRIKQQESLFDYSVGKNTKSYTDLNFPDSYLVNNMLSADRLNKARNACIQAKVSQDLMQNCIYDVGFTGSTEFARATARVSDYAKIVDRLPLETRNSDIKKPSDQSLRIYAESYIRNWATSLQTSGAKVSPIRSLIIESTSYPEFPYSGSVTTEAYPTLVFLFYYGQNGWITNSERLRIEGR